MSFSGVDLMASDLALLEIVSRHNLSWLFSTLGFSDAIALMVVVVVTDEVVIGEWE